MFGGSSGTSASKPENAPSPDGSPGIKEAAGSKSPSPDAHDANASPGSGAAPPTPVKIADQPASGEKRSGNGSPPSTGPSAEQKKRRSVGVSRRASSLIAQAKNSLFTQVGNRTNSEAAGDSKSGSQTPLQKLGKQDQALAVPQGQHNNAAGESLPGPRSTFRVGVWEDRNKKCRRTMEDTHAFLYNFLHTPAPVLGSDTTSVELGEAPVLSSLSQDATETDNGYFAIFDGHAGTFAADWCGKKLHIILEDTIRKHPNQPIPELLDQTFTTVDSQLEKLPLKHSGCTAAIAVLRWEDRVPSNFSATGSQAIAPAMAKALDDASRAKDSEPPGNAATGTNPEAAHARLRTAATRQRVLYTANVGDARIILCRSGKALRLSYDHKGSDENEGRRIANAGGLILNNRVNGVLAVTRALGDSYIKDLVTGHPYTTETVIQPELDEFMIIACDGVWDVCSDQEAVDLVRNVPDPVAGAKLLVDHALARFSTDNLSCMIVRFDKHALMKSQASKDSAIGVEGDPGVGPGKMSELNKIVSSTKQMITEGTAPAIGVSASNNGHGRDPAEDGEASFVPTIIDGSVEEEPSAMEDSLEVTRGGSTPEEPADPRKEPSAS